MNITYLIGNGFDLNLGLKTKYADFLQEYRNIESGDLVIGKFKSDIANNLKHWADAESAFGEYTERFNDVNDFCTCHMDFCMELAKYLDLQESRLNFHELNSIIPNLFANSIQSYLLGFREEQKQQILNYVKTVGEGFRYNFITFNYTKTLDMVVKMTKSTSVMGRRNYRQVAYDNTFGNVLHIHGFTDKDMVLGVNDESQIANMALFRDTPEEYIGQIIKRQTNQLNEEHMDEKCTQLLNGSDLICVYGMSIGKTDTIWWQRICTWLKQKSDARAIIYVFGAPKNQLIRTEYHRFEREKKEQFVGYADFNDEEKDFIMKRIHISPANLFEPMKDLVNRKENKIFSEVPV